MGAVGTRGLEMFQKKAMDVTEERHISKSSQKCGRMFPDGHEGLWKKDSVKVMLRAWSGAAGVHGVLSLAVHVQSIPKQRKLGPRALHTR